MSNLTLFPLPPVTDPKPRPIADISVYKIVSEKIIKQLNQYSSEDYDDVSVEELAEVLNRSYDLDGYKLAKKLEDKYKWEPDTSVVEKLDSANNLVSIELDRLIKEWVITNEIKPKYKEGDVVIIHVRNEDRFGSIVEIRNDATYGVKEEGQKGHWIVKFEDVKKIK